VVHAGQESLRFRIREIRSAIQSTEFSAADIVSLAKAAGMKYITITSKHHDGFAMFATQTEQVEHCGRHHLMGKTR